MCEDDIAQVAFKFHSMDKKESYREEQHLGRQIEHFDCAMVANDRRSIGSQDSTCFYAIMFTDKPHESPYRLINFNKIVEWDHRTVDTDYSEADDLFIGKSLFLNAFLLE